MRILILGGTEFVGRAVAEEAVGRGWDVTVFNRGRHTAPAGVTVLHGDRTGDGGLAALADGTWDAVVDTWSGAPRAVRASARLLADRAERYVYVSTRSVYGYPVAAGATEDTPEVPADPDAGQVDYATDKRGAELAALAEFGAERALFVRAGLILGPYENIGRLPWWLNRVARGGPVVAPGPRGLPVQYIDARDLARWMLDAADAGLHGAYDLVSPSGHTTMGELLDTCVAVAGPEAELRWIDPETILAAGVSPWMNLPIWTGTGEGHDTMFASDVSKALATGLRCRPVAETVADTWEWLRSIGGVAPQRPDRPVVGLPPELEAKLLEG